MIKSKIKASFFHFIISILVVGGVLFLLLKIWYPNPFFDISGIASILLIILAVDLVLGPLLTFVVFKPKKRTLKLDLSVIALIQICALSYGIHTVYQAHPLYVVYAIDRFTPINTNEISISKIKYDELKKSKLSGPTLAYLKKPTDPAEMSRVTMEVLSGKPDIDTRAEYYAPFENHLDDVFTKSLDTNAMLTKPEHKIILNDFIAKYGKTLDDYAFLPLVGKAKDVLWVFDRNTGQPVDVVQISPWS